MTDVTLKMAPEHADDILSMLIPGMGQQDKPQEGGPMPAGHTPVPMKPASDVPPAMAPPAAANAPLGKIQSPQGQDAINPAMAPAKPEQGRSALGKVGHVLGQIGGVGLSALAPGVAAQIPQTPLGKIVQENHAEKIKEKEAEIGQRTAQTGIEQEKTDIAKQNSQRTPVTDRQGNTYYLDQAGMDKYATTQSTNQSKEGIASSGNDTKKDVADINSQGRFNVEQSKEKAAEMLQNGRPVSMDQLAARATKEGDNATLQKVEDYKKTIAQAGKQEPGNFISVTDGQGNTLGFADPKSRDYVPFNALGGGAAASAVGGSAMPMKPSGQTASRMQQGSAVERAGDNLIEDIRSHRDKIGNVNAIVESAFLGTPLADPDEAYIATEIGSFAALNPAMHGFRGSQAMDEFKKLIGGIPKNPDALIASIKAIQRTAGALQPPSGQGAPPAGSKIVSLEDFLKVK